MQITNMHEAEPQLARLIEQVLQGEEIVIGQAGKPVARLIPYEQTLRPRKGGQWRGRVQIAADFDTLPKDLESAFKGEKS